jgi:predicted DNA-binding protein with PD1-like motif
MHAAVNDAQAHTSSGYVAEGTVRPTLEVFLTKFEGEIHREPDPATGLELLALPRTMPGRRRQSSMR